MRISDEELYTWDFDWFAVDRVGYIAHFATGARAFLPESVRASAENRSLLQEYFELKARAVCVGLDSSVARTLMTGIDWNQRDFHLKSYLSYASKGLFSYETFEYPEPMDYFKLLVPSAAIGISDLPYEIKDILLLTRFNGTFKECNIIRKGEIE